MYHAKWRHARARFMAAYPVCRNTGELATEVDHIIPHRGDTTLFWDTDNWQPLSRGAHLQKTIFENALFLGRENHIPAGKLAPLWWANGKRIPTPSRHGPHTILLCGPPCAGKTTWAKAQQGYTVIDMDDIAQSTLNRRWWTREELPPLLEKRNALLAKIIPPPSNTIVITTASNTHMRVQLQYLLRAYCVVMDTPAFACIERLRRQSDRMPVQADIEHAINRWHARYQRRMIDLSTRDWAEGRAPDNSMHP